jgi:Arc/MetJ-type ribon-helix-helix transcriptional regulator
MTPRDTLGVVARAISVRLDEEALRALARLEATGLSRSQAIRKAIVEASDRLRRQESLAAELEALEADERDRREMREVAEMMESLRAPG